jgi:chromosomal replication initiator protein
MDKKRIWRAILNEIEVEISTANFVTWFNNTYIEELDGKKVVIGVPNGFSKEWLEKKFDKRLKEYIEKYYPKVKKIEYQISGTKQPKPDLNKQKQAFFNKTQQEKAGIAIKPKKPSSDSHNLNPKYTFETLVVGGHNDLAKASAEAVIENPGIKYNPLFIYGGVGLGKTHILQAIGNATLEKGQDKVIRYVTSEKFSSDFVNSVKGKTVDEFKNFYRDVDLLLIDDVQFIGGKEGTQEQFFHTFNTLYHENKQIVLCSDRPPRAIPALEERLCSRFEGGMIVDIQKPDIETRLAILLEKINQKNQPQVEYKALEYIAKNVNNNVRELEGYLNKFIVYCELKKINPDYKNAKEILGKEFLKISNQSNSPENIIKIICDYYKSDTKLVKSKTRKSDVIKPRQVSIYFLRKKLKMSFPLIGKILGGRDHTTIIHGFNKVKKDLKNDPILKQDIEAIEENYLNQ